jgi:hypothetical protein
MMETPVHTMINVVKDSVEVHRLSAHLLRASHVNAMVQINVIKSSKSINFVDLREDVLVNAILQVNVLHKELQVGNAEIFLKEEDPLSNSSSDPLYALAF